MAFKFRSRANITMPANTAVPVNAAMPTNTSLPMFRTSCETEMQIWKYSCEWIAFHNSSYFTYKQICKHTQSDVISQYM